jgi:predicted nucleic acid-binding protein
MIFVDTNVFMYAVGREHPLREDARAVFREQVERGEAMVTSAEVLQELLHAYLPVNRLQISRARCALAGPRDGPGDSTPSRLPPRPPDLEGQAGHPSEVPGVPGSQGETAADAGGSEP